MPDPNLPAPRPDQALQGLPLPTLSGDPLRLYLEQGRLDSATSRASMRRVARVVAAELLGHPARDEHDQATDPHGAPWALLASPAFARAVGAYRQTLVARVQQREDERGLEGGGGLSTSAANARLALLRGMVRALFELRGPGGARALGADDREERLAKLRDVKRASRVKRVSIEERELVRLDLATEDRPPNGGALDRAVLALLSLGLRRSEAAAARWGDLELLEGDGGLVLAVLGKGGKLRRVPVTTGAGALLEQWRERSRAAELDVTSGPVLRRLWRGDHVSDHPMTGDAVYRRMRRLMEAAGVELRGAHSFRRFAVSALLRAGIDLASVQDFAGHSDPRTTASYDVEEAATRAKRLRGAAADPFRAAS